MHCRIWDENRTWYDNVELPCETCFNEINSELEQRICSCSGYIEQENPLRIKRIYAYVAQHQNAKTTKENLNIAKEFLYGTKENGSPLFKNKELILDILQRVESKDVKN